MTGSARHSALGTQYSYLLVLEQHACAAAEEPAGARGRLRDAADAAADDVAVGRQVERDDDRQLLAAGIELVIDPDPHFVVRLATTLFDQAVDIRIADVVVVVAVRRDARRVKLVVEI